ncbi:MAG: hypothetical protein JNK67_06260 [Alphaproteobacteria bacterium]|nr:hypothetical protein [Alphaproteobacteria bacterium]
MTETTVPSEFLRELDGIADPLVSRLLTMLVGLGGEVFVLRAELQRVKQALAERGGLSAEELERVRRSDSYKAWLAAEERGFAAQLLDPLRRERDVARPGQPTAGRP